MGVNISKVDTFYFPKIPILHNVFKHSNNCQTNRKLDSFQIPACLASPSYEVFQQESSEGNLTKATFETDLRKPLAKAVLQDLGDPRSPCINLDRTPLIFDDSVDTTFNFEDTFSDLFVETETTSNTKSNTLPLEDHDNDLKNNGRFIENSNQSKLDPRSPSISFTRTPITFNHETSLNTVNKTPKGALNQNKRKKHTNRQNVTLRPKQMRLLKRKAKFNVQCCKTFQQKINRNNENAGIYMSKLEDGNSDKKFPSKCKRRPLGCVPNGALQIEELSAKM